LLSNQAREDNRIGGPICYAAQIAVDASNHVISVPRRLIYKQTLLIKSRRGTGLPGITYSSSEPDAEVQET
jgi:hypothetical protein